MTDPLQQAREALRRIAEAAPDEPDLSHGDGGFEAGTIARTALAALPESLGERERAKQIREEVEAKCGGRFSPADAAAVEAVVADLIRDLPDPSPKGASE